MVYVLCPLFKCSWEYHVCYCVTRPDISRVVSVASGICINLKRQIVKWILRYLRGTIGIALMYHKDSEKGSELVSYSDSDFTNDLDCRRSLTGYAFSLSGCVVSCKASIQPIVTLSMTEAEYMALTEVVMKLFG